MERSISTSGWRARFELLFPPGTNVHPGVFEVVTSVLGERPSIAYCIGERVIVAATVPDDSPASVSIMESAASELLEHLPNARLGAMALHYAAPRWSSGEQTFGPPDQ